MSSIEYHGFRIPPRQTQSLPAFIGSSVLEICILLAIGAVAYVCFGG